jgi:hypothetical protein
MKPQQKRLILFLALIAPGMLLMIFACSRYPSNGIPAWIPISWGFYLLAAITFITVFGRRIIKSPTAPGASPGVQTSAKTRAVWLMAVWSGLFLYGAFKFAKGEIPAERAIPAGLLLLAWILVFAWLMRRDVKSRQAADDTQHCDRADSLDPMR